ncbi:MAG: hypothetical protein ABW252_17690 [Polyangiales bacterium]
MGSHRVFLLSPARTSGPRAAALVAGAGELGRALAAPEGALLGDVFAYLSSLYFRGKLAYALRFGAVGLGAPGALIITPGHGLCRPSTRLTAPQLAALGTVDVSADNPAFVAPLLRDAAKLHAAVGVDTEVVLLGSIATGKYVDPLLRVFGARLMFPREFVGRGDMSRGGLLLRAVRVEEELSYAQVEATERRGRRARRIADL